MPENAWRVFAECDFLSPVMRAPAKRTANKGCSHVTPTASIEIYRDGRKVAAQYKSGDLSFFADPEVMRLTINETDALLSMLYECRKNL